jgi:hypothetical protein
LQGTNLAGEIFQGNETSAIFTPVMQRVQKITPRQPFTGAWRAPRVHFRKYALCPALWRRSQELAPD